MIDAVFVLQLLAFGFTLWLGLYLLARDIHKPGLRYAGLGLVTYALGLAFVVLAKYVPALLETTVHWRLLPVMLPSVFWMAATWHLMYEVAPVTGISGRMAIDLILLFLVILLATTLNGVVAQGLLLLGPVLFLVLSLMKIRQAFRDPLPRQPIIILLVATVFFLLGMGLLLLPLEWLSSELVLLAISFDLILLGFGLGSLDAYEEGTRLLPDALRSLLATVLVVLPFGAQVLLVMLLLGDVSFAFPLLLFSLTATAIVVETFSSPVQAALDKVIFADRPAIQQERQVLRSVNAALPRRQEAARFLLMDENEFARLTRRALSHFNDLEKLAASPLTQLPAITVRLGQKRKPDNTLERTHELKALLAESILKLKPYSDKDFDSTEAWRYYNALYFPYVRGLKPYSVPAAYNDLDDTAQTALEWIQTQVPERTLYNWQTTAARLVAQHLREVEQITLER